MGTLDLARLLAQVVAILVVARGLHAALGRRLGQPLVVSEIAAGVLLGPSVLGAWLPTSHGWLFAPSSLATLETVSTLGVLLFAFLVGLEVDPTMLRGRVRVPVAIGLGSFLFPAIGGVVAGWLAHDAHAVGTPPALFATFVGVAIGVSAFPVLARFLVEHRLLGTELGAIAMASAATADFLAWSALAVLVALVRVAEWPSALTMWLAAAALGVALALIRPLLLRLDRGSDTAHDAAVVGAVVLVFAGVAAAEALGLHGLLVAFVAGALVPRSRIADGLIDRLESLVVLVLLPLFFASSGLRTDLGAVHEVRRRAKSSVAVLAHGHRLERVERVLVVRCGPEDDALRFGEVARRAGADVDVLEIGTRDRPIDRILERVESGSYHLVVVAFARALGLASTFAASPLLERVAVPILVVRSSEAHANEEGS